MVQRRNNVEVKGAKVLLRTKECALDMVERENASNAALKDVQTNPNEEEYVSDTVHTAIPLMNLQLSHRLLDQSLIRLL